jgi:hypothetical protein
VDERGPVTREGLTPSNTEVSQYKMVNAIVKDVFESDLTMNNIDLLTVKKFQGLKHLGQYSMIEEWDS